MADTIGDETLSETGAFMRRKQAPFPCLAMRFEVPGRWAGATLHAANYQTPQSLPNGRSPTTRKGTCEWAEVKVAGAGR